MDTVDYQRAIRGLAKAQTTALLSYGQESPAKIEKLIVEYLKRLPTDAILESSRDHELFNRHAHISEPTASGMYLKLIHGRKPIDEALKNWGRDGPWIGPLKWFHCTYMTDIGIGFMDGEEFGPNGPAAYPCAPIYFSENLIYFDGVHYGDWELQNI